MHKKLNVIFMGKDKPSVVSALKWIAKKNNVKFVVGKLDNKKSFSGIKLVKAANELGIPVISDKEMYDILSKKVQKKKYKTILTNIDLVISFLYWKKIKKPLLDLPKMGCINFHPAPLPEYRGLNGYSFAILQDLPYWGVSAHFVDENFDTGDLIKTNKFKINTNRETAFSLEQKTQEKLVNLFEEVINIANTSKKLPRKSQREGKYYTKSEFEKLRKIKSSDSLKDIDKKCRAFWYPPYEGAFVKLKGKKFTIVNDKILEETSEKIHKIVGGM